MRDNFTAFTFKHFVFLFPGMLPDVLCKTRISVKILIAHSCTSFFWWNLFILAAACVTATEKCPLWRVMKRETGFISPTAW